MISQIKRRKRRRELQRRPLADVRANDVNSGKRGNEQLVSTCLGKGFGLLKAMQASVAA